MALDRHAKLLIKVERTFGTEVEPADFALVHPLEPLVLVRPVAHEEAMTHAMREAIKAALQGEFRELDRLELEYLNVLVRVGEFFVKHADGTPFWWFDPNDPRFDRIDDERYAPFVVEVAHGFGPRAETALAWCLAEKCRQCAGRLRHVPCRVCDGRWHLAELAGDPTYTDLEGVLIDGN
jgi:hypothetical protein